ncbi:2Fe-2S iron-sulfur cluster-binding protein [Thiohalophilus sp.]|uniref:2Fe-2S iron-sulfur cluster-binding protein n=1 Tax=Thiohalophilus sp. TaxID=3028392 RepID=UPI003977015E
MDRLLTVSRAARLVGVSRGTLQKQIQDGDLPSFEGMVRLDDLNQAYPNVEVEDNTMLEKIEHIIDNALHRARGDKLRKLLTPDLGTLAARVSQLSKELAAARYTSERLQLLLEETRQRLDELQQQPAPQHELQQLTRWLDSSLAEAAATPNPAQLLTQDTLLRVILAQVHIMPSGHEFFVEGNNSILDAALSAGVALNYGCSNGNCGKCKARLISGEVRKIRDHEYRLGEAEQNQGYLLACSNTAVTDIVLAAEEALDEEDIETQTVPAYIKKITHISDDLAILHLNTVRRQRLRFLSGQKARLSNEAGEASRYHIASCPCDDRSLQFHVSRDDTPFSGYVFHHAKPYDAIEITGPQGHFVLRRELDKPLLFFAVDSGFAPVKSLIEHALTLELADHVHLYWIATGNRSHYQHNICRAWTDAFDHFHYTAWSLNDAGNQDLWQEQLKKIDMDYPDLSEYAIYFCGSKELTETARQHFIAHGLPKKRMFTEEFPK